MTADQIIDGIIERKEALHATNQQIADASNVPKTTVDRILRRETSNPSFQTVVDIAAAVGYEFSAPAKASVETDDATLKHIIYVYEQRCADLEREGRMKTAQSNLVMAEKSRWIRFLTMLTLILVSGIILILLYDVTHPDIGWFQRMFGDMQATGHALLSVWR